MVGWSRFGDTEESHVHPSKVEATKEAEIHLNFKQKSEDPAEQYVAKGQLLERKDNIAGDEWYKSVELAFWVRLAATH